MVRFGGGLIVKDLDGLLLLLRWEVRLWLDVKKVFEFVVV